MDIFSIGGTHFAVDAAKSRISLDAQGEGMLEVNIDIHGDDDVFMRLTEDEEGEWSWALYPPVFSCTACAWRQARPPAGRQGGTTMPRKRAST